MRAQRLASILVMILLTATAALAEVGPVAKLLPRTGEVKDWKVYPGSLQYAKGENLTEIYDGGYELYTKNGVLDAATQMYSRGRTILTVTVHTMASPKAAKSFFSYWQKQSAGRKPKPLKIGSGAFVYAADGATNGYLVSGRYFVTVMDQAADKQASADTESFLRALAKKAK